MGWDEDTSRHRRWGAGGLAVGVIGVWVAWFAPVLLSMLAVALALMGFVICLLAWSADEDQPDWVRYAAWFIAIIALGQVVHVFVETLQLEQVPPRAAYDRLVLSDQAYLPLLVLAAALMSTGRFRRSERILLWVGVGLLAFAALLGIGFGSDVYDGEMTPAEYRQLVAFIRAVALLPVVAACWVIGVWSRSPAWRDEEVELDVDDQGEENADEDDEDDSFFQKDRATEPKHAPTRATDIMAGLDARLARGEISESTYLALKAKYETSGN